MEPVAIHLSETSGLARNGEPISLGIPFAKGQLADTTGLQLIDAEGSLKPADFTPLCHWPDGSIRWLQMEGQISLKARADTSLTLAHTEYGPEPDEPPVRIEHQPDGIALLSTTTRLFLHTGKPCWDIQTTGAPATTRANLTSAEGQRQESSAEADWQIERNGTVCVRAVLTGRWQAPDQSPHCRFRCTLTLYHATGLLDVAFRIHNPRRARHPGGLWDLGDEGSLYFRSLELVTDLPAGFASLQPDTLAEGTRRFESPDIFVYQDSSGGENWNSRNHLDRDERLTTHFPGYEVRIGGERKAAGKRSNPSLIINGPASLQVVMPGFWQNFPSSLGYTANPTGNHAQTIAGLFPRQPANAAYELQGGEQKTLRCLYQLHHGEADIGWAYNPTIPTLDASIYESAGAFPWFSTRTEKDSLDKLLQEGLEGENNFFAKREVIDEYGWRHFGDLFADHESLYLPPGSAPFISHYNNQYDPIYGFARQFALSGDRRWFELMDDLARHVVDIDIYHTDQDRAEYNHGLFWHTDHYLPAHTATHRTFSRHNHTSSTPGQTGGGPAEEHCYTTGLLYHHLLTGDAGSRQAVLDLAHWVTTLHEGSGSLMEQLLRITRRDLPKARSLLTSNKPQSRHVYLFNRGTGNYLNTLLDAHLLEPQAGWLVQAEKVIRGTIHPDDTISERNLLTAESSWSYLVLLAAISRFLLLKEEASDRDTAYDYARHSLVHYSRWMLANEQPFLARSEELEFANHTWVAQDIRKAMLLYQASHWDPGMAEHYRNRAREFQDHVLKTLQHSPERTFTRIQVILLQNYGPHQTSKSFQSEETPATQTSHWPDRTPNLTWAALLARMAKRLGKGIKGFALAKEQKWLSTRMERQ